jgi:hypothetical protein
MMANLNYIYNNDVEVVNMLWMRRAPFNHLVKTFRVRGCFKMASTPVSHKVAISLHVVGDN